MSPHHLDWCGDGDCGDPSHKQGGFVEQGFAAGYFQGWSDARAGRPYGHTPTGRVPTDGFYPRSADDEGAPEASPSTTTAGTEPVIYEDGE